MAKTKIIVEDFLSDEGRTMWNNLEALTDAPKKKNINLKNIVFNTKDVEINFIRLEMQKMIANSYNVIADCDEIMHKYTTMAEYIASEPKIAKTIHQNLINRLERILVHLPAFEIEPEAIKQLNDKL